MTQKPTSKPGFGAQSKSPQSRRGPAATKVVWELAVYGYPTVAERRLPNDLGWQLRLAGGQVVTIFDSGSLLVQGVNREPVERLLQHFSAAPDAGAQPIPATAHIRPEPPEPAKPSPGRSARFDPTQSYIDANGRPIRLPGNDTALPPPPPPPKVRQNPKTRREMLDRLRALRYSVRSDKPLGGGEWQIELKTGQTIYYREGGRIRLGSLERDYRLERLFKIDRGY
jgi:hypothetical protein